MRILIVINGMHPRQGGPPRVAAGSAIALARQGHEVRMMSTRDPSGDDEVRSAWPGLAEAGVRLDFCADESLRGFIGTSRAKAVIAEAVGQSDVVHLHGVWHAAFLLAGRAARTCGVPYFVSVHGVFDRRAMERIRTKWVKKRVAFELFGFRCFLNGASGVVFGSESEAEHSWRATKHMTLEFVPNGAEVERGMTEPTEQDLERMYRALPETRDWTTTVLCRSRFHEEKGIDMLIEAFNLVTDDFPDARLLIAGIRQDEDYEARFMDLIRSGPAADRIVVTADLVGEAYQFMYHVADVFAIPSIAEGFSVALIEGLAHSRPLLITRYCHMSIVGEVGSGVVVEPDVHSIAAGLRKLLSLSEDERQTMGEASRALFEERYTWDRVAQLLSDRYEAAVRNAT